MAVQLLAEQDSERPRRARPKELSSPPAVFGGGPGGAGSTVADGDGSGSNAPATSTTTFTDWVSARRPLAEVLGEQRIDAAVAREARRIADLLSLRRQRSQGRARGRSRVARSRYDGNGDEVDLDATLEVLADTHRMRSEDLVVRRPTSYRRSIALVVDVSGSMTGDKAVISAAAVGALVAELADEELTVVAFWSDLAVLRTRGSRLDPVGVIDDLMRIEPRGLTNLHGAIELATHELSRSSLERRCIVLLSDCVHNAGPDPRLAARCAPTTHVLLERTGEHDRWLGERIARTGGGRLREVAHLAQVAPALDALLS